jgi:uncharacterized surface protein with fasciclin (FAS1) repeats
MLPGEGDETMNARILVLSLALVTALAGPAAAAEKPSFRILSAALERTDLAAKLAKDGPVTILAPTDAAFGRLPADTLKGLMKPESRQALAAVLADHVLVGRVGGADLLTAKSVRTAGGRTLAVRMEKGKLTVGGAVVKQVDVDAFGVTVHILDDVIVPPRPKFEVVREASLPEGFPEPGPVGEVVVKEYPRYRLARAEGNRAFWTLFNHNKKNRIAMTAPVEMTMSETDDALRQTDMAFLYERTSQGKAGRDGAVKVLDGKPVRVLSIGVSGPLTSQKVREARAAIERRLGEGSEYRKAGKWRLLGYNSPMVPAAKRFWELQLPVENVPAAKPTDG